MPVAGLEVQHVRQKRCAAGDGMPGDVGGWAQDSADRSAGAHDNLCAWRLSVDMIPALLGMFCCAVVTMTMLKTKKTRDKLVLIVCHDLNRTALASIACRGFNVPRE